MIRDIQGLHEGSLSALTEGSRGITPEQAAKNREILKAMRTVEELGGVSPNSELRLAIDNGETLIRVVSRVTNEVIGQIPPEGILRAAELLREMQAHGPSR